MFYSKRKESQGFGDESRAPTTGVYVRKSKMETHGKVCLTDIYNY